MAHQACFHQPLGQEWRRRAGLCLGALHPLSSCSLPFISFFLPPCPHSNLLPFSLQSSMSPNSCLMPPNTQSSFHPLPISRFVCKPQGREMGEKHSFSAPQSQKTGESSPVMFPSPSSHKKTHVYMGKNTQITPYLLCVCSNRCIHINVHSN